MKPDEIGLDDRVGASESTVSRELDGEMVLLNLDTGIYFGLDGTGTRIWNLLAAGRTLRGVIDTLIDDYDVDAATLERDLRQLVERLSAKGLVTPIRADRT
ncbi:MAG TPA: PqqD family protein [Vicinamibacterales bacterium]|nr:PqqD family protein [Vicinamibacterales bacterium]